ncbi:MAG: hypothetical protein ABFC24_06305 [Methanoregulaceae archaeon]
MADRRKTGRLTQERGVSESIGFILIFSLVVTGIGIVTLYGYPLLMKQQMGTDIRIMEKTFIVLQNDIKSLVYKNVPYKETSLKVGGGMLFARNNSETPQTLTVYVNGLPATGPFNSFSPGELRFDADLGDTVIVLENGAVITAGKTGGGSTMLAEPRWYYDDQTGTFVISLIRFRTEGPVSRTGVGTIGLRETCVNYTEIAVSPAGDASVQYTQDPENDYSVAWDAYFTQTLGLSTDPFGYGYRLPTGTSRIVVKEYTIEILSL